MVFAFISLSLVATDVLIAALASEISLGTASPVSAFLIIYQSVSASLLPIWPLKLFICLAFNSASVSLQVISSASFLNTNAPESQYISPSVCILES